MTERQKVTVTIYKDGTTTILDCYTRLETDEEMAKRIKLEDAQPPEDG